MPTKFDVQHYQPNWDPVTGGTFVSVQDVLNATSQMWGEVLTTMIDIIPKSIGDLVDIIAEGMPQLIDALIAEGAALFGFSGATPILEQLIGAGGGTGNTLAEFANLFAAVGVSAEDIALDLFGVSGHSLADLGADFRALLGNPLWGGIFDPIVAAEQWLESVLTPAGALSSSTQIPAHLFGSLSPGNASANLLPDGGFDQ